ncbi:hypothetical protein H2200_007223 [Cladophialophora chaetospira]|uniref:Uncharacterized protein n=1 Tax=Cladophialophora chaetospira TaxID=386627 RepID=A0AA38X7E6_9EURO|nr:hypothetical protein H2200_007223 [Cladophialophora chaetospira]
MAAERPSTSEDTIPPMLSGFSECSLQDRDSSASACNPADILGISKNPKLRLMGIAQEVRDQIFAHVLVSPGSISFGCGCFDANIPRINGTTTHPNDAETAILRVCRNAYHQGRAIFYGRNMWYTTNLRAFKDTMTEVPLDDLGGDRLSLIRDLAIKISTHSGQCRDLGDLALVTFIGDRLPALQHLQLLQAVPMQKDRGSPDEPSSWKGHGELLSIAAQITKRHPKLKKAVLSNRSSKTQRNPIDPDQADAALIIDVVPRGDLVKTFQPADPAFSAIVLRHDSQRVSIENLVLDCHRIRQAIWGDLHTCKYSNFAFPDLVASSEPTDLDAID